MKLTNDQLVQTVKKMQEEGKTKSEICRECGYVSVKEDGTERLHFVNFYEALIEAKGLNIPQVEDTEDVEENELYNELIQQFPEEAVDVFVEMYSMEDLKYFRDAYCGDYNNTEEFAESYYDMGYQIPWGIVVDWDATWHSYLRHYFIFENGFVFRSDW